MSDIKNIEDRLHLLETIVIGMNERETVCMSNGQMDDAGAMALYSIVAELAQAAGISPEDFFKHYQVRFRWWHDYYLRQSEDVSSHLSAMLDLRTIEQASVDATYAPIFDPPPSS
jgi:hypothetical protein